MLENWKILSQRYPDAAVDSLLYEVGRSRQAFVETMHACNLSALATTFRIRVSRGGEPSTSHQYLYYDAALAANATLFVEAQIRLEPTDAIYVQSANGAVAFTVSGLEQFT